MADKGAKVLPGIFEYELPEALPSNATFTSVVFDVRRYGAVWIEIDIGEASTPSYTIDVLGGLSDDITKLRKLTLSTGDLSDEAGVTLVSGAVAVDGSALTDDAMVQLAMVDHPAYIAIRGTHDGAGTTGERISYRVFGRAR